MTKVRKVTKVVFWPDSVTSGPFRNMGRLGLDPPESSPKSDILDEGVRIARIAKVTELRKVTIPVFLPDSVFLEAPTQAKGSPHIYVRIVTFAHFYSILLFPQPVRITIFLTFWPAF